jgi:methyl-accepting chemotaxis protein
MMTGDRKGKHEIQCMIFIFALLLAGILLSSSLLLFKDKNLISWAVILIIGITVISILSFSIAKRLFIRPLHRLEKAVKSLSEGDFSFNAGIKTDDELEQVSKALYETARSLDSMFKTIKNGSYHSLEVGKRLEGDIRKISESTKLESEAISSIASSLEQMNSASAEISQSTESLAISTEQKAVSLDEMVSSIGEVSNSAQEISNTVDATSASIEELSTTIKEVAHRAEELSAASEETLTATEEISSSIKDVEESAKKSSMLSEKVKNDASTFGITSVEKTVEGIQNIKISFEKTAMFIKKLGGRSDEIGKILTVIDEITDQTTLLALNAAILAAQAGEHGKGFSVVADEIKDLAERTSFSTREIAELIRSVQQELKDAILAMEGGLTSVEEGLKVARDAGDSLKKIVDSSIQSAEMSLFIERSTAEQAKTTKLVSNAMERVKDMVSEVARATMEQSKGALLITKATEKMSDVANLVKSATGEQLINIKQIAESIELVSEKNRQIAKAVREQRMGSNQIFSSVEKIKDIPKNNLNIVFEINQALKGLLKNTDFIMKEMGKFRFGKESTSSRNDTDVLCFGIEPVGISPAEALEKFSPLTGYLKKKLQKKIELKVASNNENALRDMGQGGIHVSYMAPSTYVKANKKHGTQAVVKILLSGKSSYRSVIVARNDGKINTLEDIKGHTFAFGETHSLSGYIVPRILLLDIGIDLKDLFHYDYLGSHEEIANAVLQGNFDAGGVTERVAIQFRDKLKFIKISEDLPGIALCVSKNLSQKVKDALKSALIELTDTTAESASILHSIDNQLSGFQGTSDAEYATVRTMMLRLGMIEK